MSNRVTAYKYRSLKRLFRLTVFAIAASTTALVAQDRSAVGRSVYEMGAMSDGTLVSATVVGDVTLSGMMVACAKCHRRSGYGNEEPGKLTPPLTAGELFTDSKRRRDRQFRSLYQEPQTPVESMGPRTSHPRPAYDNETLARAIQEGIDSSGRVLDLLMPRYDLDDATQAALIGYLRRLSPTDDPGVDATTIHFSLVTTDDVPVSARQAAFQVVDAYVSDHNREVNRYQRHIGNSPNYKDDFLASYRHWTVHRWHLSGEPYTYYAQLSGYQRQQPVFALLAGVSNQSWQPIGQFCDRHRLPCLFPTTPLPAPHADGGYTLYLSEGLRAEADTFRDHVLQLIKTGESPHAIHQFAIVDTPGEQALRYSSSQLRARGIVARDHLLANASEVDKVLSEIATKDNVALMWTNETEFLAVLAQHAFDKCYFSGGLLSETRVDLSAFPGAVVLSPYRDDSVAHPREYRVRSWMRSRRISLTHQALQYNTYFALTVTDHALRHMVDRYSRDFLIERVEHETENALNPGVYPKLSLGPNQRYASRTVQLISVP